MQALCLQWPAYISHGAQRIRDNLLPCIDDRSVEHRVLVQGRLGALHKADLEPIFRSLIVAKVFESGTLEHDQSLWISRTKVPSDSSESWRNLAFSLSGPSLWSLNTDTSTSLYFSVTTTANENGFEGFPRFNVRLNSLLDSLNKIGQPEVGRHYVHDAIPARTGSRNHRAS